jgi:hypothetical protein
LSYTRPFSPSSCMVPTRVCFRMTEILEGLCEKMNGYVPANTSDYRPTLNKAPPVLYARACTHTLLRRHYPASPRLIRQSLLNVSGRIGFAQSSTSLLPQLGMLRAFMGEANVAQLERQVKEQQKLWSKPFVDYVRSFCSALILCTFQSPRFRGSTTQRWRLTDRPSSAAWRTMAHAVQRPRRSR